MLSIVQMLTVSTRTGDNFTRPTPLLLIIPCWPTNWRFVRDLPREANYYLIDDICMPTKLRHHQSGNTQDQSNLNSKHHQPQNDLPGGHNQDASQQELHRRVHHVNSFIARLYSSKVVGKIHRGWKVRFGIGRLNEIRLGRSTLVEDMGHEMPQESQLPGGTRKVSTLFPEN